MRASGPNERLRSAMSAAGFSVESLAEAAGFNPKQVGRWLAEGVIPRRVGAKDRVARLLGVAEADIWPRVTHTPDASTEVLTVYSHRAEVPRELWQRLIGGAQETLDVLVYAGLFLPEQHPRLRDLLAEKAASGVTIRFLVGDPDGRTVAQRSQEEGIGDSIAAKIRNVLTFYTPLVGSGAVQLRLHDTTLYTSLYRSDGDMLVNPHIYGMPAAHAPTLHLRQSEDAGLFDTYAGTFETIWHGATPPDETARELAVAETR